MDIRRVLTTELPAVHRLLARNGWEARLGTVAEFSMLIDASQVAEVALDEGEVIGFIRGITDGLSNGYLSMLVVAAEHRRRGVGRRLVEHAVASEDRRVTWVLRAGREGAAEFFARLGFEPSTIAMERRRHDGSQSPSAARRKASR
jgi:ribosomal protein S18 acetylase RimI-like enzyme